MMQARKRMYITMDTMADKAGGDACIASKEGWKRVKPPACMSKDGSKRWSRAAAANGAAKCWRPADCNQRASTASPLGLSDDTAA